MVYISKALLQNFQGCDLDNQKFTTVQLLKYSDLLYYIGSSYQTLTNIQLT